VPVEFGISTEPMVRSARVANGVSALVDRFANIGLDLVARRWLDASGRTGMVARAAKLCFLDMPIASLAQVVNHEYGHVWRDPGMGAYRIRIAGWPWPVPFARPRIDASFDWPLTDLELLGAVGGGSEASSVMADTIADRLYDARQASYFDVVTYAYAKLDASAYVLVVGRDRTGDPEVYAQTLARIRSRPFTPRPGDADALFQRARLGAALNLCDWALLGNVAAVISKYVVHDRAVFQPAAFIVKGVGVTPGLNYAPTPRGAQYQVNVRLVTEREHVHTYVRWTQSLQSLEARTQVQRIADLAGPSLPTVPLVGRLLGAGARIRRGFSRTVAGLGTLDLWRDADSRIGGRAEAGLSLQHSVLGANGAFEVSIGAKTAGYLPGFALEPRFYVNAALRMAF
jgi:hypothetical protein